MSLGRGVVVGVDGGGTSTVARVGDAAGRTVGEAVGGGSNWESIGVDAAVTAVMETVGAALASAGASWPEVGVAWFGLAGVDWPADVERLAGPLRRAVAGARGAAEGGVTQVVVGNDVDVALRATLPGGAGIVSVVGTGTVTAGRRADGRTARTMAVGWGEPSGATSIVREALHAVAAAHHRTGPATELTARVCTAADVGDVAALFESLTRGRRRADPGWATLVTAAAADGDTIAQRILVDQGERHGAMVVGIAAQLDLAGAPLPVALTGGVHRARDPWFAPAFAAAVRRGCPHAQLVVHAAEPVAGAVLLALDVAAARRRRR